MIFWHKIDHFDPYNVLLAIATNKPQRLNTGFELQGHIMTNAGHKLDRVNVCSETAAGFQRLLTLLWSSDDSETLWII